MSTLCQSKRKPAKAMACGISFAVVVYAVCNVAHAQVADAADSQHPTEARFEAHFAKIDRNRDGTISRDEAQGRVNLLKQFDRIDTNHDGKLSREELKAHRAAQRQAQSALTTQHAGSDRWLERVKVADANQDGALSREEVKAANMPHLARHFEAIDTNRDGALSPAELRAYGAAQRARREGRAPPSVNGN